MSDSKDSIVTYTEVSSLFEGLSDIGSLGVEGPPMMEEDLYAYVVAAFQGPPSPDYVPGRMKPEQAPPLPEFVPKPVYLEFMPLEDEILLVDSPTADSPRYIPEEDPVSYPADEGDDDDDESSDDDEDDDDVEEDEDEDGEEEEEHPALIDFIPLPPVHHTIAKLSISVQAHTLVWSEAEIDRLLAIPSPLPLRLSPWSSPLLQIPSPPLPISPPLLVSSPPLHSSPTYPLGYRAAMIRLRAETPSTSHPLPLSTPPSGTPPLLPIPLPTSSPPLLLPFTSHKLDILEVTLLPRKRLCIALGMRYEVDESSFATATRPTGGFRVDYGFVATLENKIRRNPEREVGYEIINTRDEMLVGMPGEPATDDTELRRRMMDFTTTVRQDTDKIYGRLDDAQDDKALISKRVNMLYRDKCDHAQTTRLMETEAKLSRQKMVPKRTTRSTPATTTTTTTTSMTDAQLKALINQGISNTLAARDANRRRNGKDSHDSGMGARSKLLLLMSALTKTS
uniref:Reverse transcriptase domain-containing protein n=1 Tax=Tanacetum cinerariifolium TaxID=118510 RepID=A0A6L2LV39_TANCI|nr:hypothetical protein [Tanacetum cinerariifolium]